MRRPRVAWRAWAHDLALVGLHVMGTAWSAEGEGRPVVLVHGLGGHPGQLRPLGRWLQAKTKRPVAAPDLGELGRPGTLAGRLGAWIEGRYGADAEVDVIAHGFGGVVVLLELARPDRAWRLGRLITLGTPLQASWPARGPRAVHTLDLRPGSQLLTALEKALEALGPAERLIALWSPADDATEPPEATRAPAPHTSQRLSGCPHASLVLDRKAWRAVRAALDAA